MKNRVGLFALFATLILISFTPQKSSAQYDEIGIFLRAGAQDAETLVRAYLEPLSSGIGGGLNTGWFTSASVHKPLGFSLKVRGSLAFIPEDGRQFDITKLGLDMIKPADPSNTATPTVGGTNELGPEVVVVKNGDKLARFNMPSGTGYHFVPAPMIQASVGLIANTDVIIRFVPEMDIGDYGQFSMRGIGLKHEITAWLPAENIIPVDISIMAGYSTIDLSAPLNVDPYRKAKSDPNYSGSYSNQKATTSFDTFTAKIIVGQNWPFLDLYAAAGYQTSTMTVALRGDYPVPSSTNAGLQTETITNPFKYTQQGENRYSLTAGATLKLFFFDIFAQYTLSKYPVFNAGVGFSFR